MPDSPEAQVEVPPGMKLEEIPPGTKEKILGEITSRLKEAEEAQTAAFDAHKQAAETEDPEEKEKLLREAGIQEKKAKSMVKLAQRLQSGVWQGGVGGAGIGAGVGMGLGAAVGTIVGGVVSIPTTGLGLLTGAATGAIRGPWYTLSRDDKKTEEELVEEHKSDAAAAEP